jgi:outer membrane receptor protein involved in Fe transport
MVKFALRAGMSCFALACAQAASAQSESVTQTPEASGQGIGDIVVVAQRRAENLQRVPIAISALPEARLEAANISTTAELTNVTPAITLNATVGFLLPRIRGIGNSAAGPAVENSVATYVDGVYIASAPGTLLDLNNVARVEVLKGPQGTLFGRNATGGLIHVITKDPSETFGGEIHAGYGNYDTLTGDAYLTGRIAEGVSADLALAGRYQGDGWGRNRLTGTDIYRVHRNLSARTKWLLTLGPDTKLRLSADVTREVSSIPTPAAIFGTAPTAYVDASGPIRIYNKPRDTFSNEDPLHKTLSWGGSAKLDHDFGGVTLTNIAAYRRMRLDQAFDADISPAPSQYQTYTQHDEQITEELQLSSSGGGPFQWIIGAYYFDLDSDWNPLRVARGVDGSLGSTLNRVFLTARSLSGYAQATYNITGTTRLTGGFRYTSERRTLRGTLGALSPAGVETVTTTLPKSTFKSNTPTWRLSLDHDLAQNVMVYASWNRGFKSGGFNGQAPTQLPYKPEKLDSYEVGFKSTLLDRRLRMNVAAFLYDYRDVQVNTFLGSIGVIYNGAKARIYGLDADVDFAVTDRLTISAGAVALHDRFTDFPLAQIARPNGNGTVTVVPGSATGNRLPFASDFNGTFGFTYRADLSQHLTADFAVSNLYSTGFYTQPDNYLKQSSYITTNASVNFKIDDGRFNVKLWVNNLFDEDVLTIASAASTLQFASYAAPRTYGISVGTKF